MADIPRAGHACQPPCIERETAMLTGKFVYRTLVKEYVDLTVKRRMGVKALLLWHQGYGRSHHGEPYSYPLNASCCPWCGGDLISPPEK